MLRRLIVLPLMLVCVSLSARAAENMIGRQSQNEGMLAVPAPGKVTIDGDLSDWDWSGRIWVFADTAVRDRYSVEAAAMWDKENLYLAAKWRDPTPMYSTVDPAIAPEEGWKSDSWQMRVQTGDQTLWITTWYFAPKKQPIMHLSYWKDRDRYTGTVKPATLLVAPPGGTSLGEGVEMAYKPAPDGKGFFQEIKIPWTVLYKKVPPIEAGVRIRIGSEFLWGDPTGRTWPVHRYADNMQPGKTSREFYWTAIQSWGDVKLVAEGPVPVRQYHSDERRIEGTVPVAVEIPADAARFTIVLDDAQGRRVRTLAADCDPADYRSKTAAAADKQRVEVAWDCLDDQGKLVAPGQYRVRGLTQKGLSADYEMCFYNPGTPPWETRDGSGAWGADHSAPIAVGAGGDWTFVTWPVVEGGSGLIGIDASGRKRWQEKRGTTMVAADDKYVYAYVTEWYVREVLCRFEAKTGKPEAFVLDGKPRTFDLPLKEILKRDEPGKVTGLAVSGDKLAVALDAGKVAILDAASAAVLKEFDVAKVGGVAFSRDGKLYALAGVKPVRIDTENGALSEVPAAGLDKPVALAVDLEGNLVIADMGKDSQVKAFKPDGKPAYTCGKRGGRPLAGRFDPEAMSHVSSVAVDHQGRVWVTENWNYPRRVSVWGRDGKLVRDYLGNTGYAGASCFLHDTEVGLGYCGPIEFALDLARRTWTVTQVLWVPDKAKGESFDIHTASNVIPSRFVSSASGKPVEYFFTHEPAWDGGTGNVVFMQRRGRWQPVAAVCQVAHISGEYAHGRKVLEPPSGEWKDLDPAAGVIWSDKNRDGKVQRSECEIVLPTLNVSNGWGGRIGDDLSIYTDGLVRYKPLSYTDDGAPVYGLDGRIPLGVTDRGDLVPVPGENRLLCLSFLGYAGPTRLVGIDLSTGQIQWYYPNPYPGVHGSHRATMPQPGLLIGPLKICGIARVNDEIGNVFMLRGNLGQDFFFTTDGLFVGTLFQDGRLPGESLPDSEEKLRGMPMEGFSEGGEPFNGWFGKQNDGKIRLTTGMARQAGMILEIKGLDTIRRFDGGSVSVDPAQLAKAEVDNASRASAGARETVYTINRVREAVKVDGNPDDWKAIKPMTVGRPGQQTSAAVRLAWDDQNLYAFFDVADPSPWRNQGKDMARLFKTGDAVDIQLAGALDGKPHPNPLPGDERIVISQLDGKPVAVLMRPVSPGAPAADAKFYRSPVGTKKFDRVEILSDAAIAVKTQGDGYRVEVALPWKDLGLTPAKGRTVLGDVGFISSDAAGTINTARTYWANPFTNLVNDEPLEAWLYPQQWGEFRFE